MILQERHIIVAEEEEEEEEEEDGAETERWEREKRLRKRHKSDLEREDRDPLQKPWWKVW